MKTAEIALVTLVLVVPVALCAQEKGSGSGKSKDKPWDQLTPYEQGIKSSRIKGSRQVAINPVVQKDGINKGCVIAYGHFMRPPFVVSYVDHKLLINDVQVEPSILLEREAKKTKPVDPKILASAQKQIDVSREIREKYRKDKFWKSDSQLKAELLAFAKSKDGVLDAKWDGDAFFVSFVNGTGFDLLALNAIEMPKGWKQKTHSELKKEGEDAELKYVRETLQSDDCIVFRSSGKMRMKDPRDAVIEIMGDNALSNQKKADALADKVFLGSYEEAFDLLENYNPKEWSRN